MTNDPDRDPGLAVAGSHPARTPVSLIIAVFNSESSLRVLHQAIAQCTASEDFEIVYVDDSSTDGSLSVLRDIQQHATNVVVVEQPRNRGQAKATLAGIFAARHEVVVTLDDDLQHNPRDIQRLLAALDGAGPATLVMGVADALKRPLWRAWSSICANAISNLFLRRPLPLQLTTFCAFHRRLCADLDPGSERDLPLMTALVQAADVTLTVPVHLDSSLRNHSRYGFAALFGLFMSRSSYYRLPRVLGWLAAVSLLMIAGDALLLINDKVRYPLLTALVLVVTLPIWLMLGLLAIKVDARVPQLLRASRSA
jgi:glycosyltransferase involved in cell wall biosynthesis